jgi:hypothetical protein
MLHERTRRCYGDCHSSHWRCPNFRQKYQNPCPSISICTRTGYPAKRKPNGETSATSEPPFWAMNRGTNCPATRAHPGTPPIATLGPEAFLRNVPFSKRISCFCFDPRPGKRAPEHRPAVVAPLDQSAEGTHRARPFRRVDLRCRTSLKLLASSSQ